MATFKQEEELKGEQHALSRFADARLVRTGIENVIGEAARVASVTRDILGPYLGPGDELRAALGQASNRDNIRSAHATG